MIIPKYSMILLCLIAIFCNSGCMTLSESITMTLSESITNSMKPFLNQPVTMVIASYGQPSFKYPDGHGGELLVYQDINYDSDSAVCYNRFRTFFVNKSGIVYHFVWKGI